MKVKTNETRMKMLVASIVLAGLLTASLPLHAGNLEPSAEPGSTMKTLDEVEPRIPISSLPYTVSASGSYYITGDLTGVLGQHGLTIEANDVTIDLMGHSLIGPNPNAGTENGIYMNGRSNVEIRNGTVCNFLYGIYENDAENSNIHRIINVRAISNTAYGICLSGRGNLIKNCTAAYNVQYGISTGLGSTLVGNTACFNLMHGIYVPGQCLLNNNTANFNNLSDGGYFNISADESINTLGLNHNPLADYSPPQPNPSQWAVAPYDTGGASASMTAATASDSSGVEYFFECKSGDCNDSGWQDSATYVDTEVTMGQVSSYTVRTRDKSPEQYEGEESTPWKDVMIGFDLTPPTPYFAEWLVEPEKRYVGGQWYHHMEAELASDPAGVEYRFDCVSGSCTESSSGWQDEKVYDVMVLGPGVIASYTVTYRDKSPNQNEGSPSSPPVSPP